MCLICVLDPVSLSTKSFLFHLRVLIERITKELDIIQQVIMPSSKASNWSIFLFILGVPITARTRSLWDGNVFNRACLPISHSISPPGDDVSHVTTTLGAIGQLMDPSPPNMFKLRPHHTWIPIPQSKQTVGIWLKKALLFQWTLADPRGPSGTRAPYQSNFIHFHAVFSAKSL